MQGILKDLRAKIYGYVVGEKHEVKKERGIDGWKYVVEDRVPDIMQHFLADLWRETILHGSIQHIASMPRGTGAEGIVTGMTDICSIQLARTSKKDISSTPIGKLASTFRFLILSRALYLAHAGKYLAKEYGKGETGVVVHVR